jgi:hypothetical protein
MAVTSFEIRRRGPYRDSSVFGDVGAYERVDGVVRFAVDPGNERNQAIVDLALAPRHAGGLVHFDADFCILQPADPASGNGSLLFDVSNRGGKPAATLFNSAVPAMTISEAIEPGNGFLFRQGWTVAWCGWQWDVPRIPGLLGLTAPEALEGGRPIRGQVCVEIVRNTPARAVRLCDGLGLAEFLTYPAADPNERDARLTVQEWPDGPRTEVARERWRFAREVEGKPVPDADWLWLDTGFEPGKTYDLFYTTSRCPVAGTGLLAVRDFASALRYGADRPTGDRIQRTHAFGISQSGRFLRTFLHHGLNADEQGRPAFDGVIAHVAGGRRGEFNHRYAQPSVEVTAGFGHRPPYSEEEGLLDHQRAAGCMPKVMYTNSSSEYWRGDASLVHISPDGERDLAVPDDVRVYLLAGTQHGAGAWPLLSQSPLPDSPTPQNWMNAVDYRPLLRAALVNLDRWVADGTGPPASAYPRIADGTAVTREQALSAAATIPGLSRPDPARMRRVFAVDLGPQASKGVGRWPATLGAEAVALVPAVDGDGNEVCGVRLPDVAVPVATHTGWNARHPSIGSPEQLVRYVGSTVPFAPDKAARQASGDPRPSLAERYASRDEYERRVREATHALVSARHLLDEDVERVVKAALVKFDGVAAGIPARPGGGG